MNSPSFNEIAALFPSYLSSTIDKYLRADIGRSIAAQNVPHSKPQFVGIEGQILSYYKEPGGLLVSDGHATLAFLDAKTNPDLYGQVKMVPLSLTRFLVIGSSSVALYDLDLGIINQVVKVRASSAVHACRLDASTFVLGDRGLVLFTYVGGALTRLRHWPLRMHQVSIDHLVGMSYCFLAARANVIEVYDPASVPGIRSVALPFRPQSVVAGRSSVLIANEQTVFVYNFNLTALFSVQARAPITALAELADGCVAIAYERKLEIWKAAKLHHTYELAFTPVWMDVPNRELVCAEDNVLYTFLKN